LIRTSTMLEGVCYTLNPEFNFMPGVRDYIVSKRMGPAGEALVNFALAMDGAFKNFVSIIPVEVRR